MPINSGKLFIIVVVVAAIGTTSRLCIPVVATLSSKMSEPEYCWEWGTGDNLASFTVHPLTLGASLTAQVNHLLAMQETRV